MSYKFNLDHTLAIADIHDMITIDIKPETRCSITGGDVEIHGYLTFRGSYLTPELGEAPFEGSVPLDITLPYLGGAPDIRPEVVSFDYRVENKKSLTLNLEVALKGYAEDDNRDAVMDAWIDPIVDEPVYEEAVIEPFDFNITPVEVVVEQDEEEQSRHEEELVEEVQVQEEELVVEEVRIAELQIEEAASEIVEPDALVEIQRNFEVQDTFEPQTSFETEEAVFEEEIPYSPLVEITEPLVEIEEVRFDPIEMPEVEVIEEPVPVEEVAVEREAPKMSESASALMDELFAMKRGTAFKKQMREEEAVATREEGVEAEVIEEEQAVEVAPASSPDSVITSEDSVATPEDSVATPENSVARQFADGETTIKMIYVEDEEDTLGGVLERYTATLDDVWNLEELADGVSVGDCVMLRYEKTL